MPRVIDLDALPPDVLADLQAAAAANGTTLEAEATSRVLRVHHRDALPPLGDPIPSLEMSAPYDFTDPPGTPVEVIRHNGPDKFEFWYGEDKVVQ